MKQMTPLESSNLFFVDWSSNFVFQNIVKNVFSYKLFHVATAAAKIGEFEQAQYRHPFFECNQEKHHNLFAFLTFVLLPAWDQQKHIKWWSSYWLIVFLNLVRRQLISGENLYQIEKATIHTRQLMSIKTHLRKLHSMSGKVSRIVSKYFIYFYQNGDFETYSIKKQWFQIIFHQKKYLLLKISRSSRKQWL